MVRIAPTVRVLSGLLVALTAGGIQGAILFVKADTPPGGDGTSWATSYTTLQDALAAARQSAGVTEIWVAKGTYKPDEGHEQTAGDRSASFTLVTGVSLRGGFAGTEDPASFALATRDFVGNATILSGDLQGNDGPDFLNRQDNSMNVVRALAPAEGMILDGFTITAAYSLIAGGGLRPDVSLLIVNCRFSDNHAETGGALYSLAAQRIEQCTFLGNRAVYGGAVYIGAPGRAALSGCSFLGNEASSGGAIYINQAPLDIQDSSFQFNWAYANGGALDAYKIQQSTITSCLFVANDAFGMGGGVYSSSSSARVVYADCLFQDNIAEDGGGGMWLAEGTTELDQVVFKDNLTWYGPGGGLGVNGTAEITSCTFSTNIAAYASGGGLSGSTGSVIHLSDSSATGNQAVYGGGAYLPADATLTEVIFADNTASQSGGGVSCADNPRVSRCKFTWNFAGNAGGGIALGRNGSLTACEFLRNTSVNYGGGVYASTQYLTVTNCLLNGNGASQGGAIYGGSYDTIVNCTIFSGFASSGGAYYGGSQLRMMNSSVWNCGAQSIKSSQAAITYSCIENGIAGQNIITADPLFADRLGQDAIAGTGDDDLRVVAGSPCIDAGTNNAFSGVTDLAGKVRSADDPATVDSGRGLSPIVDIGAYEYISADGDQDGYPDSADACPNTVPGATVDGQGCPELIPGDFDQDGDVDRADLETWEQCATGPGLPFSAGCEPKNLDGNGSIDQSDFGLLQRCWSGEDTPGRSECAD